MYMMVIVFMIHYLLFSGEFLFFLIFVVRVIIIKKSLNLNVFFSRVASVIIKSGGRMYKHINIEKHECVIKDMPITEKIRQKFLFCSNKKCQTHPFYTGAEFVTIVKN